jgi:hypothetical protein
MIVIFTFLCVMVVTAVLFGGWVIMSIIRLIGGMFSRNHRQYFAGTGARGCNNPGCRTVNPPHASFCRRCGADLSVPMTNGRRNTIPTPKYNPTTGAGQQVASV